MLRRLGCFLVLSAACGCASRPAPPPPVAASSAAPPAAATAPVVHPAPPALRLPRLAHPVGYKAELEIDPKRPDFTGTLVIDLRFDQPTPMLWLNAHEIAVERAELTVGNQRITATPWVASEDFLGLDFGKTVPVGLARLRLYYRGQMHRNDGDGIYTVDERGALYAFTQFEATDARQAFPCFDEPGYKTPWQLTLRTPGDLVSVSNTQVEAETIGPDGWKTIRFARTKPLPSYLVAFAVGPFEMVDAGHTKDGVPVRTVVPRGRTAEVAYTKEVSAPILDQLVGDLGVPYPYQKLDVVAVPVFNAGAMENAGLITFRQELIVVKPGEMTDNRASSYAYIAAHEMAHQWFGDLVTMAWWDDVWLNEAFATWMGKRAVMRWKPEVKLAVRAVRDKSGAMRADSLASARMVRQPVETKHDIDGAFDGITYEKGAAVLAMMERWVGSDKFMAGVKTHLTRHAFANATYDDFVGAISAAAGHDVKGPFDSFIKQSGLPLVSVALDCQPGSKAGAKTIAPPSLTLGQRRYAPLGSTIDPKRTWQIPVCVRYGAGKQIGHACTLLTDATGTLALPEAKSCPDWVMTKEDGVGYYRTFLQGDLGARLRKVAARALTVPERIDLLGDVTALVTSGDIGEDQALALTRELATDPSPFVAEAATGMVNHVDEMVPNDLRPHYQAFVRKLFGARARALGWKSRPGDEPEVKNLRANLLALVGDAGADEVVQKQATELAGKWLDDHHAVEPELVGTALFLAARTGDRRLFDRVHADAKKAQDREERRRLLDMLGDFTDPALVDAALALTLGNEFEPRDSFALVQELLDDRRTRAAAYDFLKAHFDELMARLPAGMRAGSLRVLVALCDDGKAAEIETNFGAKVRAFDNGPRVMKQLTESMHLCAAGRQAETPAVVAFFRKGS